MDSVRRLAPALLLSILALPHLAAAPAAAAGEPTTAQIEAAARGYRIDLGKMFASPEAEKAARAEVIAARDRVMTELGGQVERRGMTPERMLAALTAADELERVYRRHDLYLFLRWALDTNDQAAQTEQDELREQVRVARRALTAALEAYNPYGFERASRTLTGLAPYQYAVDEAHRGADHRLSAEGETIVAAFEPLATASEYPRLVADLDFGTIVAGGTSYDVGKQGAELSVHPDPAVRREADRKLYAAYASRRDVLAEALVRSIEARLAAAKLRGFTDTVDQAAFERHLTAGEVDGHFAAIAKRADVFRSWQEKRAASTHPPLARRWTPAEAVRRITESSAPLGAGYQAEIAALFDPANGRADLMGKAGDEGTRLPIIGTASVYPIGTSVIYVRAYGGYVLDLIVMAHEGGHAAQAMLMSNAKVPMAYAAGPGYFTESFGRFQEMLLLDHLLADAAARGAGADEMAALRDEYAARLLSVFNGLEEASVELAIHRAVAGKGAHGAAESADDLDRITREVGAAISDAYQDVPERARLWEVAEGYYMSPFSTLDNPYSSLLALDYLAMMRKDPEGFRERYLGLLSAGYPAAPRDLLMSHLAIDLDSPRFVDDALDALDAELKRLYGGNGGG